MFELRTDPNGIKASDQTERPQRTVEVRDKQPETDTCWKHSTYYKT